VGDQRHVPAALALGKTRYPLYYSVTTTKTWAIGSVIKQDSQISYKVTLKHIRVAIVAVEKQ
jgi:hypothetical protein